MEKYYRTGEFAKKANTTQRTIRYYDKIGLLKPTFIMDNGYRKYSDKDFLRLQRIISLRHLGFSLEEIYPMLLDDSEDSFKKSLALQEELVNKKIGHLEILKESLKKAKKLLDQGDLPWDRVTDLIRLTNEEGTIIQQYKSSNNLSIRIALHSQYSKNKQGWFPWVFQQIDFSKVNRLLEIGCGNGELWKATKINLRNREIFLADIDSNMIEETKKTLGDEFNYTIMDCEDITFKKEYFDTVIANHVLFYLKDLKVGLKEIQRVLKPKGLLYCTTYGKNHMKEIHQLVKEYDNRIELVEINLAEKFGLSNGKEELSKYFNVVDVQYYKDCLIIDKAQPLVDYILSCPGNQNEIIAGDMLNFKQFIEKKIKQDGYIKITKEAGIFICEK